MRAFHYTLLTLCFSLLLLSCSRDPGPPKEITVNDEFAITVPGYMTSTDRLAGSAPFQYQSKYRTVYAVALSDDRKSDFQTLESYTEKALKGFTDQLKEPDIQLSTEEDHQGISALKYEIRGNHSGEEIHYYLMTLENNSMFYQVCAWTLSDKDEKYSSDIKSIVNSFRLL